MNIGSEELPALDAPGINRRVFMTAIGVSLVSGVASLLGCNRKPKQPVPPFFSDGKRIGNTGYTYGYGPQFMNPTSRPVSTATEIPQVPVIKDANGCIAFYLMYKNSVTTVLELQGQSVNLMQPFPSEDALIRWLREEEEIEAKRSSNTDVSIVTE